LAARDPRAVVLKGSDSKANLSSHLSLVVNVREFRKKLFFIYFLQGTLISIFLSKGNISRVMTLSKHATHTLTSSGESLGARHRHFGSQA